MKILDFLTSPWAIVPEKLLELQAIYATHLRGEKIDLEAIEARLGRPLASEQQEYQLREGGVAVLSIGGVLAPKANMFTRVSGGASTEMLRTQLESMAADPRVRAAVVNWDSPGGSVFGVPAAAAALRSLADAKPTVSVSTGTMASAAYWIGSAANAVFIEGLTDYVGSIGVVATHSYSPRAPGTQTTSITAGRYKRMATGDAPLDKEGAAYLQQQVDEIYRVFVDAVAAQRGATADQVIERMADGRIFIGQQALDAGLVDGVSTVDALVEQLATDPAKYAARRKAVFALGAPAAAAGTTGTRFKKGDRVKATADHMDGMKNMTGTVAEVQNGPYYAITFDTPMKGAKNPHKWMAEAELQPTESKKSMGMNAAGDASAAVAHAAQAAAGDASAGAQPPGEPVPPVETTPKPSARTAMTPQEQAAAFAAEHPQAAALVRAEGAACERDRITAVRAQSLPGHEALVEQLAMDGKTTGPEAAAAVLAAERQARNAAAAAHANDAPPAAPASAAPASEAAADDKTAQVAKAKAYATEKGVDFVAAMKALGFAA